MEKCEKTHILGIPERLVPVQLEFLRYNFGSGHF